MTSRIEHLVGPLITIRPSPPQAASGLRAALTIAVPIPVAVAAGSPGLGLIAGLGCFVSMYGAATPASQLRVMSLVSVLLGLSIAVGELAGGVPWRSVCFVGAWTAIATVVAAVADLGPPGASALGLVAAVGTLLPPTHVGRDAVLVFADGLLACAIMATTVGVRVVIKHQSEAAHENPHMPSEQPHPPAYPMLYMAARIGVATLLAGAVATAIGLHRPSWAMLVAAGVMALGAYAEIVRERALAYTFGTAIGVALAALLLTFHPGGLVLAPVLAVLAFVSQLFIVRNFAIAMMFVTPLALAIVDTSAPSQAVGSLLTARLANTVVGAVAGVLVAQAVRPAWAVSWLRAAIAETEEAATTSSDDPDRLRRALARLELVSTRTAGERRAVREAVQQVAADVDDVRRLANTEVLTDHILGQRAEDTARQSVDRQLVLAALQTLSDEHRQALFECYFGDASIAEAADTLGVSPGTVMSRTHYALHALRHAIDGMGGAA